MPDKPKIVILDAELAQGGDLSWTDFEGLGDLQAYDKTKPEQIIERAASADILVTNKFKLGTEQFEQLLNLKLICLLATGYDNVDIEAAKKYGITVCNARGYSSDSVAQHVFAMLLACTNRITEHNQSVQKGEWYSRQWSYTLMPLKGLKGLTMGICGFGKIGKRVADLARAFDMKVIAYTRTPDDSADVTFVNMQELCKESDVISIHLPHTSATDQIFSNDLFERMKEDAILINTGRGSLIKEEDLRTHLLQHPRFIAALDVLSSEPPIEPHPLIGIDNCLITPHIAWANPEARARLLKIVAANVKAYIEGQPQNVVS